MDAVEYIRQKGRMCKQYSDYCTGCPLDETHACVAEFLDEEPEFTVKIVQDWAHAHPIEADIKLTDREKQLIQIYIEKGYQWAARNKRGDLHLYKRCPERLLYKFKNTSPTVNATREVLGYLFPVITWENSPVRIAKIEKLEVKTK